MTRTTAIVIGDEDIRLQARDALRRLSGVEITGELAAFEERHAHFVAALAPEIVVVDCGAEDFDPARVLRRLQSLPARPSVIAIVPNGTANRAIATELGAATVVETEEALRAAVRKESLRLVQPNDYDRAA